MKRFIASFLILGLFALACSFLSPTSLTPSPTSISNLDPIQIPWDDRSIFQNGLVESARPILNELPGASVYHIAFNIAETIYEITGTEEVRYTNNESVALDEVHFRLFPNILGGDIQVTDLRVDGQSASARYALANSLMIVPLPQTLQPGESAVLKMDFALTVPQEVEVSYGMFVYYANILALAHAYPMICVFDEEGWNAEIPAQNGDLTYADASFYVVRVSAPKDLTLVTTGREVSSEEAGQLQSILVASGPARDFFLAASTDYQEFSQTFGEVTIHSYASQDSAEGAKFAAQTAADSIEAFNKRYASYPYSELDLVATPNLALGIEYPGSIVLNTEIYEAGNGPRGSSAASILESTVAHEVGHQYFYNLIGNDQLDDPWLDEALAQFATLQYYKDLYGSGGAQGFHDYLTGRWERVAFEKIPIGLPVASYQGAEYGAIVYGRGPLFIDALRERMGDSAFDAFLREYTETLSWEIATPELFQSLAEQHCACDLDDLFNEWVYP